MVKFVIHDDRGTAVLEPKAEDEFSVGTGETSRVRLTGNGVARRHAQLHVYGGKVTLRTFDGDATVNGEPVGHLTALGVDDVVAIGDCVIEVVDRRMPTVQAVDPARRRAAFQRAHAFVMVSRPGVTARRNNTGPAAMLDATMATGEAGGPFAQARVVQAQPRPGQDSRPDAVARDPYAVAAEEMPHSAGPDAHAAPAFAPHAPPAPVRAPSLTPFPEPQRVRRGRARHGLLVAAALVVATIAVIKATQQPARRPRTRAQVGTAHGPTPPTPREHPAMAARHSAPDPIVGAIGSPGEPARVPAQAEPPVDPGTTMPTPAKAPAKPLADTADTADTDAEARLEPPRKPRRSRQARQARRARAERKRRARARATAPAPASAVPPPDPAPDVPPLVVRPVEDVPVPYDESAFDTATRCLARGDNRCALRALAGQAHSPREIALLVETYIAQGQTQAALAEMRRYLDKYPRGPHAERFHKRLRRKQGAAP